MSETKHTRITVRFTNGEETALVVDRDDDWKPVVRVDANGILHFGRDDGTGWYELLAAPRESVRSWE